MNTNEVWLQYHNTLGAFIRKRVADRHAAEDILHDVFLKIHANLPQVREREKLNAWMYSVAHHAVVDHFRSKKQVEPVQDVESDSEIEVSERAIQKLAECMLPMIERLPEPYREAVYLSEIKGMKQKDVAEKVQLSLSGVKSRIQRGRKLLKHMVLECCEVELDRRGGISGYRKRSAGISKC